MFLSCLLCNAFVVKVYALCNLCFEKYYINKSVLTFGSLATWHWYANTCMAVQPNFRDQVCEEVSPAYPSIISRLYYIPICDLFLPHPPPPSSPSSHCRKLYLASPSTSPNCSSHSSWQTWVWLYHIHNSESALAYYTSERSANPMVPFFLLTGASSATPGHLALPLPLLTCSLSQSVLTRCLSRLSSSGMTLKTFRQRSHSLFKKVFPSTSPSPNHFPSLLSTL